jgi:hypothetical protein
MSAGGSKSRLSLVTSKAAATEATGARAQRNFRPKSWLPTSASDFPGRPRF